MGVRKMGELEGASATAFASIFGGRNPGKLWLRNIWGASDNPRKIRKNYSSPNFQLCGLSASGEPSGTVQLKKGRRMT